MKKAVLMISHGDMAKATLGSASMIIGQQEDVVALGLYPGESPDKLIGEAVAYVNEMAAKGYEVLVLADLYGGSPYNASLSTLRKHEVNIVTGMNLPMVIEALTLRDAMDTEELLKQIRETAKDGVKHMNREKLLQG